MFQKWVCTLSSLESKSKLLLFGPCQKKSSITQESIIAQQQKQHVQGMFGFQPCREGKENISAW